MRCLWFEANVIGLCSALFPLPDSETILNGNYAVAVDADPLRLITIKALNRPRFPSISTQVENLLVRMKLFGILATFAAAQDGPG